MKIIEFPIFLFAIYLNLAFDMLASRKPNNAFMVFNGHGYQAISAYGCKLI